MLFTINYQTAPMPPAIVYIEHVSYSFDMGDVAGDCVIPQELSDGVQDFENGRVVDLDDALSDEDNNGQ